MVAPKHIKGDPLRAYINWEGRWRHVYIHGSYDQATLVGEPVRMLYFKLTKNSKELLAAEKTKFEMKKLAARPQKRSEGA